MIGITNSINLKAVVDLIYPVGAIYTSANNTSPATFLGGTWTALNGGNACKIITGDTPINAKQDDHSTQTYPLHFIGTTSAVVGNGNGIGFWSGKTNISNSSMSFPTGATEITVDNLWLDTTNLPSVYMWQRTA